VTTAREAARSALLATSAQLQLLDDDDFDGYVAGEPDQVAACQLILEWPLAEFDDETQALVAELVKLQRRLCEQFDRLLAASALDGSRLGQGRRALEAYAARPAALPLQTRAG
jgi:hypothetical protein